MFRLELKTDDADIAADPDAAVADILTRTANVIRCRMSFDESGTILDGNGNTVGRWTYTADERSTSPDVAALHGQPYQEDETR